MSWQHHTGDARSVGRSQHRTEVAWVSDTVANQEKWVGHREYVIQRNGVQAVGERHDALMSLGSRFTIKTGHRHQLHRHSLSLGLTLNGIENVRWVLGVGNENLLHCPTFCF
jgi:hypothetical protein